MRTLTATLSAAQQQAVVTPFVKVTASAKSGGIARYHWTRLYEGAEPDYYHGAAMPADGSLVRVRVTPSADSNKLYWQRAASPGPDADFSQWTYANQYGVIAAGAASLGAEVSIFFIVASREILRIVSANNGASWGGPEHVDYAASTAVYGLSAAYKPNGDLALFFADQSTLYVKKRTGGSWQSRTAWDKSTGDLSGVSCIYDGDWDIVLTGRDSAGNYKLWSLVYGDGGEVSAGAWSALKEIAAAPSGGAFAYRQPFLHKTDARRCFFVEKYAGNESYSRPYYTHTVPGSAFTDGLWREPAPFNLASDGGLAMTHDNNYAWLSCPYGVWRAALSALPLDLTGDVTGLRQEAGAEDGSLAVELRNDDGRYVFPGQGALAALDIGSELAFSPGGITAAGPEYCAGPAYCVTALEHTSGSGKASLAIHARDGWGALGDWQARCQFRWNKSGSEASVKAILAAVLGRAGLKLETMSQSAAVTGFCPDFTINPGEDGKGVVRKLLSLAPDVLFIEGNTAYLVNPQPADSPVYAYGLTHPVLEGRYRRNGNEYTHARIEGYDASGGAMLLAERFDWVAAEQCPDRSFSGIDRNLGSVAAVQSRGDAVLSKAVLATAGGVITVPVNCGQQLYDVIAVTDASAGLAAAARRVTGITLVYLPARGQYFQRLELGGV